MCPLGENIYPFSQIYLFISREDLYKQFHKMTYILLLNNVFLRIITYSVYVNTFRFWDIHSAFKGMAADHLTPIK